MCRKMKRKNRKRGSLLHTYLMIVAAVYLVILISFSLTYLVINRMYEQEYRENAESKFEQGAETLVRLENDISNLYSAVTSSEAVRNYVKADTLAERTARLSDVYQFVGSVRKINDSVEEVMLYDQEGGMTAATGSVFLPPKDASFTDSEVYRLSGSVTDPATGERYFQAVMPVYEKKSMGNYQKTGSVVLTLNCQEIQEAVSAVLQNPESFAGVLDSSGELLAGVGVWEEQYEELLVGAGVWEEQYGELPEGPGGGEGFLHWEKSLPQSGWRIVNLVPERSFMGYMNQLQMIALITYAIVAVVLAGISVLIYARVIQPVRRQIRFVTGFTQNTGQRIEAVENNELGTLAEKMNEMLDELERMNRRMVEEEKRFLELEYAKKRTEMIAYKSQINPHFMYNTLECIRGMALYCQEKEIAKLTGSLSKLFRYNVRGGELVTIREIVKNLEEYARIIDYRFMGRFEIYIQAEEGLETERLPKMLVQPLVENAVLHGLEPKTGKGTVEVLFEEAGEGREICITVQDDGWGMEQETLERLREQMEKFRREQNYPAEVRGIGIFNVYMRLQLFFGEDAQFEIKSAKGAGTCIRMRVPKEERSDVSGISGGR